MNGHTNKNGLHPGWSDTAVEAVQAINRITSTKEPLPTPVIRDLLSNLKHVGYGIPQALHQISRSLTPKADSAAAGYGPDHARGAAEARDLLTHAAFPASELSRAPARRRRSGRGDAARAGGPVAAAAAATQTTPALTDAGVTGPDVNGMEEVRAFESPWAHPTIGNPIARRRRICVTFDSLPVTESLCCE